jgi:hypothetical protein
VTVTLVVVVPHKTASGLKQLKGWIASRANAYTVTLSTELCDAHEASSYARRAFGDDIVWGIEGDVRV